MAAVPALAQNAIQSINSTQQAGAEVVRNHDVDGFSWTVLRDPAGNEFCVADAED